MKIFYILLLLLGSPWMFSQTIGGTVLHGSVAFADFVLWGDTDFPEGNYTLTIEYAHAPVKVTVRSVHGKTRVFSPITILAGVESGQERFCLIFRNSRWQVRSIDLPLLGISLVFMPRNQHLTSERLKCLPIAIDRRATN